MAFVTLRAMLGMLIGIPVVRARGFLGSANGTFAGGDRVGLGEDLQRALDTVLGCGGAVDQEHLAGIEHALVPMWRTVPKNEYGRVDWRSLRYTAHRFFMQRSSLMIKGFEPSRVVNDSHVGHAQILTQEIPALARLLFGGEQTSLGYTLEDAVDLVATLENLMFESETTLLETSYWAVRKSPSGNLVRDELLQVLQAYMVHWMMGDDTEGAQILMQNRTLLETIFPRWSELKSFVYGQIRTLDFARQRSPVNHMGRDIFGHRYTFDDAHEVAGGIAKSFASFWYSECVSIKTQLASMDASGSGRIRLSDFYGIGLDGDWRFGESEAYLRELGVLDETSSWRGKQVIISNYIQAVSNCIVSTPHYMVCCVNECEGLLSEIEAEIGSPTAPPTRLAAVVGNMSSPSSEDDDPPKLDGDLMRQLQQIADLHGGEVPMHGRLFAQWLHYVFPYECAFPHKAGSFSTQSPTEYGYSYLASVEDMLTHASNLTNTSSAVAMSAADGDRQWMSQWSAEEELFADYSLQLRAPWESRRHFACAGAALTSVIAMLAVISGGRRKNAVGEARTNAIFTSHAHLV